MLEHNTLPKVSFSTALEAALDGRRIAREGWNGKGMWVVCWPGGMFEHSDFLFHRTPQLARFAEGIETVQAPAVKVTPCLVLKAADNTLVFGWLASQTDMLAGDWVILPDL